MTQHEKLEEMTKEQSEFFGLPQSEIETIPNKIIKLKALCKDSDTAGELLSLRDKVDQVLNLNEQIIIEALKQEQETIEPLVKAEEEANKIARTPGPDQMEAWSVFKMKSETRMRKQIEQERSRDAQLVNTVKVADKIYKDLLLEYYLRNKSDENLDKLLKTAFSSYEVPSNHQDELDTVLSEIRMNLPTFYPLPNVLNEEVTPEEINEFKNQHDALSSAAVEKLLELDISQDPVFETSTYNTSVIANYLLRRISGISKDDAMEKIQNPSNGYIEIGPKEYVPERGFKLHVTASYEDPDFLKIVCAINDVCGNNVRRKLISWGQDQPESYVTRMFTIYPPISTDDYERTDAVPNLESTVELAAEIKRLFEVAGVKNHERHTFEGCNAITQSSLLSVRYGECQPSSGRVNTMPVYGDGWVDNRALKLDQNLPASVSVAEIIQAFESAGLSIEN